jgi:hypothetical protein
VRCVRRHPFGFFGERVEAGAFLRIGLASIHYIELDGGIENPPFSEVGTRSLFVLVHERTKFCLCER